MTHQKTVWLDGVDDLTGTERTVHIDRRDTGLRKYASCHPDALEQIRTCTPEPGHTILLVIAMSASEFYGPNRNGDGFSEGPVSMQMLEGPWAGQVRQLITPEQAMPHHIGSFLRGHAFLHHQNTDPAKAVGRVLGSHYNWDMHRPELVLDILDSKAAQFAQRIRAGERPAVSMGTRVPYDVCTTCGNQAPSRAQYCEHVRDIIVRDGATNGMCVIRSDGAQHYVLNPSPSFFDISLVFKPADRIAYTMYTSRDGAPAAVPQGPSAADGVSAIKTSRPYALSSVFPKHAQVVADPFVFAVQHAGRLLGGGGVLADIAHGSVNTSLAGLKRASLVYESASGLSVPQVLDALFHEDVVDHISPIDVYAGLSAAHKCAMRVSDVAALPGLVKTSVLRASQSLPAACDLYDAAGSIRTGAIPDGSMALVGAALHTWDHRVMSKSASLAAEELLRHYVPESLGAVAMPDAYYGRTLEPLTVQDPRTGDVFQTTRQQAEIADLSNLKTNLSEAATIAGGTGAALGAMQLMRGKSRVARFGRLPVALGGGVLSGAAALSDGPMITTLEGQSIPTNTPMALMKNSGVRDDTSSDTAYLQSIAQLEHDAVALTKLAQYCNRG